MCYLLYTASSYTYLCDFSEIVPLYGNIFVTLTYFHAIPVECQCSNSSVAISSYTHKASAIILTRVGTAFINLCPTSVPSPSWCTVTMVTIHHVLGRNTVSCGATVFFMSITTWYIYLKAFYSCKPDPLWIAFSITSVLDTKSDLHRGWLGLACETRNYLCIHSQCSCLHSHRGRGSSHRGWFHT